MCSCARSERASARRHREGKRMAQEQLAEGANLHANYGSSLERGERNVSVFESQTP
jgi:transcriptional regulator with XRE-family HTH domain